MSIPAVGTAKRLPAKVEDDTEKGTSGYESFYIDKCRLQMTTARLHIKMAPWGQITDFFSSSRI